MGLLLFLIDIDDVSDITLVTTHPVTDAFNVLLQTAEVCTGFNKLV